MHFTGTVYRNPYWPTWPLLEITQGCTHNMSILVGTGGLTLFPGTPLLDEAKRGEFTPLTEKESRSLLHGAHQKTRVLKEQCKRQE